MTQEKIDGRRKYATPEEASEARRLAKKARNARVYQEQKAEGTRRRRVVADAVGLSARAKAVPVERPKVNTDEFIRAHPECFEVVPIDAPWKTAESLTATHKKVIRGMS